MTTPTRAPAITIWNRAAARNEQERVFGERWVRFAYENPLGHALLGWAPAQKAFSALYGAWQSSSSSRAQIADFVAQYEIDLGEFEPGPFESFNAFFTRGFRPGARSFPTEAARLGAVAEGRYLGLASWAPGATAQIKGIAVTPRALLGSAEAAKPWEGGSALIARLCPVDYHRFHYPDAGVIEARYRLGGPLDSVNPIALARHPEILLRNQRVVEIIVTENFGRLAIVAIGAIGVGRIEHRLRVGQRFSRGQEMGLFLFGGSCVVTLFEPGHAVIDPDVLERSSLGQESLIRLGEPLASAQTKKA